MIRYPIHPATLRRRAEETSPGWLHEAQRRTDAFRTLGHYEESSSTWSRIKRVYMELQGFKCGFCERRLERSSYGNVEYDIEHFRPKKKVVEWPTDALRNDRGMDFDFDLGPDADPGYFLLPYHLENYLVSCKTCNSALKANYFPVAGPRAVTGDNPRDMVGERPYLIYPISSLDTDPEELITFDGVLPVPVGTRGLKRRRAEVTIAFFELDSREGLLIERAETILAICIAHAAANGPDQRIAAVADPLLDRLLAPASAHVNCARTFRRLLDHEPARANGIVEAALELVQSVA